MEIVLPCVYVKTVRAKRRKLEVEENHLSWLDVTVPEVSSSETEPVVSWRRAWTINGRDRHAADVTARLWKGRFYVPCEEHGRNAFEASALPTRARPWSPRYHDFGSIYGLERTDTGSTEVIHAVMEPEIRDMPIPGIANWLNRAPQLFDPVVLSDTRQADEAIVKDIGASLLIVDGMVWKGVSMPRIHVYNLAEYDRAYVTVQTGRQGFAVRERRIGWEAHRSPLRFMNYPMFSMEKARADARGMEFSCEYGQIAVEDASLLDLDTRSDLVTRTMDYAVLMTQDDVGGFSPEQAAQWTAIRAASGIRKLGPGSKETDPGLDSLRDFADLLPENEIRTIVRQCLEVIDGAPVGRGGWLP